MRKLCIFLILLGISLNSFAPVLSRYYINERFDNTVKEVLIEQRVDIILKTLRFIESRNDYSLSGASGEYGAYQFTSSTWKYYSYIFFKEYLDITIPDNQDKVARAKVRMLVDNNFTDEEIASFWNSGKKDYKGRIGVNKYGVRYNVPEYVNKFINTKLKFTNDKR